MPVIENYLVALAESDADGICLRPGAAPCWRERRSVVISGDPVPDGAEFDILLTELLERARLSDVAVRRTDVIRFVFNEIGLRLRAEIHFSEEGPNVWIRKIPTSVPGADSLRLPPELVARAVEGPGLVFVSGATASGKTSTIAALAETVNAGQIGFIMMIERTAEYEFEPRRAVIHQVQVGVDVENHATALRVARQAGVGVIAIDELPDDECALLALEAANRGALVIAGVEARGPVDCLERFLARLPADEAALHRTVLAQSLRMVIHQTLLPAIGSGQVPAHEILTVNRAAFVQLRDGRTQELHAVLQGSGRSDGQRSLDDSLEHLVAAGLVAREEALRRARNRVRLEQKTARHAAR